MNIKKYWWLVALLIFVPIGVMVNVVRAMKSTEEMVATTSATVTTGLGTGSWWMLVILCVAGIILPSVISQVPGVVRTIALVVLVGLMLFGPRAGKVLEKTQDVASGIILDDKPILPEITLPKVTVQQAPQPAPAPDPYVRTVPHVVEKAFGVTPQWSELGENGTAPVNVPSQDIDIAKRCYVDFAETPGYGTLYAVDYSYPGLEWRRLNMNEHTEFMSKVRVVSLQAGQNPIALTLKVECRKRAY